MDKKSLKMFFSRTKRLITLDLSMLHLKQVCLNDDPRLTNLISSSNLICFAYVKNLEKLILTK